jgi:hypothetical protein
MITIYAVRCSLCGMEYVGATRQTAETRFQYHLSSGRAGLNTAIAQHIREHGAKAHRVRRLAYAKTRKQADVLERHFIEIFGTLAPGGLNLQSGGMNGYYISEDGRRRIAAGQIAAAARRA